MLALALLALLSLALLASAQINTPASAVQCEPVLLQWTETGNPPYIISLLPGGMVSAAAIENVGSFTGASTTWVVDIPAGTSLTLQIRDGTGGTNYSAPFPVQSSTMTSCLGTNTGYVGGSGLPAKSSTGSATGSSSVTGSGSSAASGSTTSSTSALTSLTLSTTSTTPASTSSTSSVAALTFPTSKTTTTTPAASTTPSPTTTSATASATKSNGATSIFAANVGFLGVAGLLGAVLVA